MYDKPFVTQHYSLRVKWPGRFIDTVGCQLGKELAPSSSRKGVLQVRRTESSVKKPIAEQKSLLGSGSTDF